MSITLETKALIMAQLEKVYDADAEIAYPYFIAYARDVIDAKSAVVDFLSKIRPDAFDDMPDATDRLLNDPETITILCRQFIEDGGKVMKNMILNSC